MDLKFYEDLLNRIASGIYGTKIEFDKKGIFEWNKHTDGSISYRSIKVVHEFEIPIKENNTDKPIGTKTKVSYLSLKNSIYITNISDKNTVDIYSSGGGMVKRYTFKISGSKIQKIEEKLMSIR